MMKCPYHNTIYTCRVITSLLHIHDIQLLQIDLTCNLAVCICMCMYAQFTLINGTVSLRYLSQYIIVIYAVHVITMHAWHSYCKSCNFTVCICTCMLSKCPYVISNNFIWWVCNHCKSHSSHQPVQLYVTFQGSYYSHMYIILYQ